VHRVTASLSKLQQELDNKEALATQVKLPDTLTKVQIQPLAVVPQNLPVPAKPIVQTISTRDTVSMELIDKTIGTQAPKLSAKPVTTETAGAKPKKLVKNSVISGRTTDKLIPKENQVAADYITDVYDKKGEIKIAQDLSILKDTIDKNEEKALQIYVVTEPQTVKKLAAILKIDPKLIYDANDFSSPNLWPGQKIWIPEGAAALETTISHLNESQKAQKAKRNSNLNQIIKAENDEEGFSAVDLETDSFVVKNEPKELLAEVDNMETIDTSDYRPDLEKLRIGAGVQTSQHVFVNREVDTSIAKHYGEIGEVGVRILNDFSFYDDNAITYSAIDFREQHLAVDEWAVNAADSNATYFKKESSKQGPGDRQFTHVVKDGETLLSIAKKYDVTQSDLANWNNLLKYRLRTGQELIVNQIRGKLSYYERSLEKNQNKTVLPLELSDNKQNGLAYYNPSDKLKGVLMNNVPIGKWIQIHNNDKFKKRVVQVLGPLPNNAPKDCLLMIDKYTASNLEIKNITSRVSVNIAEIR
jgi:LysM repeat protein